MSGFITIERAIWDHPLFKESPFSEREAFIWLMAHGRLIRTTVMDLSRAWSSSPRRVAHIIRRLERSQLISVHGSGKARTIFVTASHGSPCGMTVTVGARHNYGPGAGLWRGPGLSAKVRAEVLRRDGFKCSYCGTEDGPFDIDHVKPVALGGSDDLSNLTAACATCNRSKGAKSISEWERAQ